MKKYAVFTTSKEVVDYQLSISNRIIAREKHINNGANIMVIVNEWIRLIHKDCNIGTWSTCLDNGQSINVIISGPDCPYNVRVTQRSSNVHIELYRYEYKYTVKEVN